MEKPRNSEICARYMNYCADRAKERLAARDAEGFKKYNELIAAVREDWHREMKAEFEHLRTLMEAKND
jgi:hypothetical protein